MSDNKNFNDEYQYVEESVNEENRNPGETEQIEDSSQSVSSLIQQPSVRRNAIIAILGLFTLISIIKCSSSSLKKKEPQTTTPPPQQMAAPQKTSVVTEQAINTVSNSDLENVKNSQLSLESNLKGMNDQINQLNNQLNGLTANNQVLQQQLAELQNKQMILIEAIDKLTVIQKSRPSPKPYHPVSRIMPPHIEHIHYYIQAIIPGRAWLISSHGNTITVKVGSKVPNYGIVDKIDPLQGRVITSSGKILRFNQDV